MSSAEIESVLHENRVFEPSPEFVKQANISGMSAYQAMCDEAEQDYEGFWARHARDNLLWQKPFKNVLDESDAPFFKWFDDGELNVSYNCLDRHLNGQPNKIAIIFEADDGKITKITYKQLFHKVCQFANGLKDLGIKPGDRVVIYMPMSIEAVAAMQACARIGATHSVVFGGFSAKSLQDRIGDAGAVAVLTADGQMRGGKEIPLKPTVDEAISMGGCGSVKNIVVYKRTGSEINMQEGRDVWLSDLVQNQPDACEPTWVKAEHPLFILYTSGSTGKPKGVQHSSAGYLLHAILTMKWGDEHVDKHDLSSLRVIGTVGEPINPEAWIWYHEKIGGGSCPIVDTWWQTETGAIMITPLPGVIATKPGSATVPFPGVSADVVDDEGQSVPLGGGGFLVINDPWPAMARTIYGDDQRYVDTYWSRFEGRYFPGDGCKRDEDGYFWLLGRVDDIMLVSGHNISTTEVESALVSHPSVAESAVVGRKDELTGQAIAAFVTLRGGVKGDESLIAELRDHVANTLGPIAKPKSLVFTNDLPKTRSGKIMRRLLQDISEDRQLGDVTTLANADIVSEIAEKAKEGSQK